MMAGKTYWIENGTEQIFGAFDLTQAKREVRTIMRKRQVAGELAPFVQALANDGSESWHFCTFAQSWHCDTF